MVKLLYGESGVKGGNAQISPRITSKNHISSTEKVKSTKRGGNPSEKEEADEEVRNQGKPIQGG